MKILEVSPFLKRTGY